jgi:DNA (cytosine-5)-methyltransferase 1
VTFRVIDLFAGCGGLTAGFVEAGGFRSVAAVEMDRDAAATYAANFRDVAHLHVGDITGWLSEDMPDADVVVGGPPCQGFSALGRQDPDDPRNLLWNEYLRVIEVVKPQLFVLENVPQFLTSQQHANLLAETHRGGRLEGWDLESHLLNAADYGAAQARKRVVVIGRRSGTPALGAPRVVRDRVLLRDVLRNVPPRVVDVDLPAVREVFRGESIPGPFKMEQLHVTRRPTEMSLDRYRAVPPGGNRFNLPWDLQSPGWRRHTSGSADVMGRLRWDRPSVTVRTEFFKPEKGRYLHPEEHRSITHYEAALIQGFPESYEWYGSKLSIARQIGNAVPVPLGRAIARLLSDHAGEHGLGTPGS